MRLVVSFILLISSIQSANASPTGQPFLMMGAGFGLGKIAQNADNTDSHIRSGLVADFAYAPVPNIFVGFDLFTFSPDTGVRASNYLFSTSYRLPQYTFSLLMGIQTVVDDRANGGTVDPVTLNTLGRNTNSFSYGFKVSYDRFFEVNRDDMKMGISPVLYYIRSTHVQAFNEILMMLEFRVWGY